MDAKNVDFASEVAALEYEEHIESEYPNFTTLNCQSSSPVLARAPAARATARR